MTSVDQHQIDMMVFSHLPYDITDRAGFGQHRTMIWCGRLAQMRLRELTSQRLNLALFSISSCQAGNRCHKAQPAVEAGREMRRFLQVSTRYLLTVESAQDMLIGRKRLQNAPMR